MMITESFILRRLKLNIPDALFNAVPKDFFIDEVMEVLTLPTFSIYYPRVVRGIRIKKMDGIIEANPTNNVKIIRKYKIPNDVENPHQYINIERYHYRGNNMMNSYMGRGNTSLESLAQKYVSYFPQTNVYRIIKFVPPHFLEIDPPPRLHLDFIVDMQCVRQLHEIPLNYLELFYPLFLVDVKYALYEKLRNVAEGGVYKGIEIKDLISDYSDQESARQEILETYNADFYKQPEKIETILQYH